MTTIAVAGALAQRPRRGGHCWAILQYLLGFRRLGHEVIFIDRADSRVIPREDGHVSFAAGVMSRNGFDGDYAILLDGGRQVGMERDEMLARARDCALLVNIMGYLDDAELMAAFPLRAFLDIDPGFSQMWRELGLHDGYGGHDRFVTVAENMGSPDCTIPTCGLRWATTRPPVVLDHWPLQRSPATRLTAVATWRGPYDAVEYGGRRYGLRAHEFRRFAAIPRLTGEAVELVLDIDPADHRDREVLEQNGWVLRDPEVTADPDDYRDYVQRSGGEWMVAKGMYVSTCSGWFSDRSVCYLASGRPVVAQDTGWTRHVTSGLGLLPFSTVEEATAAVETVRANPDAHARAARAVAEEAFDSDKVLGRLLDVLGVA
ncbi:MAG TPA: hypothetical protein VFC09_04435 [Candidatus Dormibacteraeota bacterium]|nr:hypothetical protein [Candidatus Dormibacteraeota bacterium]